MFLGIIWNLVILMGAMRDELSVPNARGVISMHRRNWVLRLHWRTRCGRHLPMTSFAFQQCELKYSSIMLFRNISTRAFATLTNKICCLRNVTNSVVLRSIEMEHNSKNVANYPDTILNVKKHIFF